MTTSDLVALVARLQNTHGELWPDSKREVIAAIEQLQAELLEYQQCLDAGIEHRMRRKAETEAESLRAELAACQSALWQSSEKITPGIAKAMSAFFAGWAKRLEDAARAQAGDGLPPDNWHEPADGRRLAEHNKDK